MAASKKTLYHSELVTLGPVMVTVKSDVLKSKFSKPGLPKPDYVLLEINGEDRTYTLDSPQCVEFFEGMKDRAFTIIAEGGKGHETLTYVGEAAPQKAPESSHGNKPPPNPPSQRPPPAPATAEAPADEPPTSEGEKPHGSKPPPETQEQRTGRAKRQIGRMNNLMRLCVVAAKSTAYWHSKTYGNEMEAVQVGTITSSLYIQGTRESLHGLLPWEPMEPGPKPVDNPPK